MPAGSTRHGGNHAVGSRTPLTADGLQGRTPAETLVPPGSYCSSPAAKQGQCRSKASGQRHRRPDNNPKGPRVESMSSLESRIIDNADDAIVFADADAI